MFKPALAIAIGLLTPQLASAADYVCTVTPMPAAVAQYYRLGSGTSGAVSLTTYSGPHCSGALTGIRNLCGSPSTGSTGCAEGVSRSQTELMHAADMLQRALQDGTEVRPLLRKCIGGTGQCWATFTVTAAPQR